MNRDQNFKLLLLSGAFLSLALVIREPTPFTTPYPTAPPAPPNAPYKVAFSKSIMLNLVCPRIAKSFSK